MAFETVSGIVLRYTDYKESDRILNVLTRERGLVALTAHGCRKKNSPVAAACELCCYSEFVIYSRCGVDNISNATVIESFYPIREDYDKFESANQALYMTKLLAYIRQPWDDAFNLCYHTLSFLAYTDNNPIDLELCFAVKFLKLAGYEPTILNCVLCGRDLRKEREIRFSKVNGGAMCSYCGTGSRIVEPLTLEAMLRMQKLPLRDMNKVRLPERTRRELDTIIYEYAEYNLEQVVKIRGR